MSEIIGHAQFIFNQAAKFWQEIPGVNLPRLTAQNLEQTLAFARKNPEAVTERSRDLEAAIARFNQRKASGAFISLYPNTNKLAQKIMTHGENLPQLGELPLDTPSLTALFSGLIDLMRIRYYGFMEKPAGSDPNILISCLLVDGYGLGVRLNRIAQHRRTTGRDDLIITNTLCETVPSGTLQKELYLSGWYKPEWGLNPDFCEMVKSQFGEIKPLHG